MRTSGQEASSRPRVLLTGGGRRLGRALALGLGVAGYDVAISFRHSVVGARALVDDLIERGVDAAAYHADLNDSVDVDGLLEAFARYREGGGQWHLILVGNPIWRRRGFDARDALDSVPHEVAAAVHRTGWMPQDELASVLAAAGAMVFIPWFEGFGIPLLEAFAAGTPAIHSNRTSLPEVADGAGLEVDPGDVDAVAAAMRRMEDEPALRQSLIEKGRHRAEDFSWDRTARLLWACLVKAGREVGLELDADVSEPEAP